ncbi:hypothetical protein [Actinomadura sediminis]|uniref:Uncharacterized protein n=1 Tax=Actinomadura sediminis TaxID=1038904 RepID=A0ABW3EUY3_9ACTN
MRKYDYGPLRTYEVIWRSGHVETVQGHQVTFSGGDDAVAAMFGQPSRQPARFKIHGDFPDGWRLVLFGLQDDVLTIRDVTAAEHLNGEAS